MKFFIQIKLLFRLCYFIFTWTVHFFSPVTFQPFLIVGRPTCAIQLNPDFRLLGKIQEYPVLERTVCGHIFLSLRH